MSNYPNPQDNNFYQFINKKYAKYKIEAKQKTMKQICFPKQYEFQVPKNSLVNISIQKLHTVVSWCITESVRVKHVQQ